MKYTKQEERKLARLRSEIEQARGKLKEINNRRKKVLSKGGVALRKFRATRCRIIKALNKQERVLEKKQQSMIRPINKQRLLIRDKMWAFDHAIRRLKQQANTRAYKAREAARLAKQTAPLSAKELALVVARLKSKGRPIKDGKTIVFKRVSRNFKTRVGTPTETTYRIGSTVKVKNWNPRQQECGGGKLHACYNPNDCVLFVHTYYSDKFIAIEVALKDMYAWPDQKGKYGQPAKNKIAFRKGKVLYCVNRYRIKCSPNMNVG